MTMKRELEPAGILTEDKQYNFMFAKFDKMCETYFGNTAKVQYLIIYKQRYFIRVCINRNYNTRVTKEEPIAVLLPTVDVD